MWERLDDLKKSSGVAHRPCWTVVKVLVWSPDCACLVHRVDMGGDGFVGHSVSEGRLSFHQQHLLLCPFWVWGETIGGILFLLMFFGLRLSSPVWEFFHGRALRDLVDY